MAAVGKKKKVYVVRREKKSVLLPLLIVGGAVAYYLYSKNQAAAVPVVSPVTDPSLIDYGTGITQANTPPVAYVPTAPVPVTLDSVRDQYMRSLVAVIHDPVYLAAFNKMTNDELAAAWYYVGTYLQTGTPLLNATAVLPNGQWDNSNPGNPGLFNKITAIKAKYGIF